MRTIYALFFSFFAVITNNYGQENTVLKKAINKTIDHWHQAAAQADEDTYFSLMDKKSIFIGTDADENWDLEAFKSYAMPHFKKGKAWDFSVLERNLFLNDTEDLAWFDELLDTHMGICRGSGVLAYKDGKWKIKHYVLSITVPNENVDELTRLKKNHDDQLLKQLQTNSNKI